MDNPTDFTVPPKPPEQTTQQELEQWIVGWLAEHKGVEPEEIPIDEDLDGLGLDSVDVVQLYGAMENWINAELDSMQIWEQENIVQVAEFILDSASNVPGNDDDVDDIEGAL